MKTYAVFGPGQVWGNGNKEPYADKAQVDMCLSSVTDISRMLLGGDKGTSYLSEQFARERRIPFEIIAPISSDIKIVSMSNAFLLRDNHMLERCDAAIVFTGPGMTGQVRVISNAIMMKKPVMVFPL